MWGPKYSGEGVRRQGVLVGGVAEEQYRAAERGERNLLKPQAKNSETCEKIESLQRETERENMEREEREIRAMLQSTPQGRVQNRKEEQTVWHERQR